MIQDYKTRKIKQFKDTATYILTKLF